MVLQISEPGDSLARRNAAVLALAQAIGGALTSITVALGGLVGVYLLNENAELATLPVTARIVGTACGTVPAAMLLARIGRKAGFMVGAAIAGCGGLVAFTGIQLASFPVYCLGTFLGVALHKPFDALSLGTLMAASGCSKTARHVVNALFALVIPLGALLFYLGLSWWVTDQSQLIAAALAFAAGNFLCISLSDLLPEVQFHHHDRVKLSVALLAGIALAVAMTFLEAQVHGHAPGSGHGHHHGPHDWHSHEHDHGHAHE